MTTDIDAALVRRLEECSLNAWPGLMRVMLDGWVATFGRGFTGRANSVYPLYPAYGDIEGKIDRAEALYRAAGLNPSFKVTDGCLHADLDTRLVARGYVIGHGADVLVRPMDIPPDGPDLPGAEMDVWLRAYGHVFGFDIERRQLVRGIVEQIALPRLLLAVMEDGLPIACAMGVADDAWVGLYGLGVLPEHRRRGLGEQLTCAVLRWGHTQGARRGYLQVVSDNAPAQRLYARLGYAKAYAYWYRVAGADRWIS